MNQIQTKRLLLAVGSALLLGAGSAHAATDTPAAQTPNTAAPDSGTQQKSGSVGQYVDDATITARVKARFAKDSTVSATSIKVETVKGIVELSGHVSSKAERDQAVALARAVPDVRGVRSKLTIKSASSKKPQPAPANAAS